MRICLFSSLGMLVVLGACCVGCDKKSEQQGAPVLPAASVSATEKKSEPPKPEASKPPPTPSVSAAPISSALLNPSAANEKAPPKFKVKFATTKGEFVVEVTRAWAPIGADRVYNLVKLGYFTDIAFFRVVEGFVTQFGIHGRPEVNAAWRQASIKDDPASKESNKRGVLTFAKGGPNSRTVQLFISFKDNERLDKMGFPPIGKVVQGIEVVDGINKEYGESPNQQQIQAEGNAYLRAEFPRLDYITSATLTK